MSLNAFPPGARAHPRRPTPALLGRLLGGSRSGAGGGGRVRAARRQRVRIAVHCNRTDPITRLVRLTFGRLPPRVRVAVRCRGRHCRFGTGAVDPDRLRRAFLHQASRPERRCV